MRSPQQPIMSKKENILAVPFQPWKQSHPWVSLKFCKDSQKSVITSHLPLTTLGTSLAQTIVQKGEDRSFRNSSALFECWWQTTQCAIRHEKFYNWEEVLVWILQKHEQQGSTLDAVLFSIRHCMFLLSGWRYWSCYFSLDTVYSS